MQLRYNEGGRSLKREPSTPSRVLYFPYISVPQTAWFSRVLLYWDEVGSIVPSPLANDLRQVSPYMGELVSAGLVRPIIPGTSRYLKIAI